MHKPKHEHGTRDTMLRHAGIDVHTACPRVQSAGLGAVADLGCGEGGRRGNEGRGKGEGGMGTLFHELAAGASAARQATDPRTSEAPCNSREQR